MYFVYLTFAKHGRWSILVRFRQLLVYYGSLDHSLRLVGDVLILIVLHGFAVDGYEPSVVVFGDYFRHEGVLSQIE